MTHDRRSPRVRHWPLGGLAVGLALLVTQAALATVGQPAAVRFRPFSGAFPLTDGTGQPTIIVDPQDWPGVLRVARDFQSDVERVTRRAPPLLVAAPGSQRLKSVVLIGSLGHSAWLDALVRSGRLDVTPLRGQWEAWIRQAIEHPFPGIDRALVIAGSDKRGAIYGVYDLSQQLGVSPWYWWADVTPEHHDRAYVDPARFVQGPPAVRYRGIFLNDEAPDLTNWVRAKFGNVAPRADPPIPSGVANYGHAFYARIFEVLLRLRGNYLWPAMWSNAFNEDDPENARLADEYGIVMGTSHQEPMMRAQKEWDRRYLSTLGTWNYARQAPQLEAFWREGIRRNRDFENIVTIGLRGANDTEMAPGGPAANQALLEHIVARQREILQQETGRPPEQTPQLWCLYKEVQEYYEAGMRVPDDVTLLWADDNWGNLRRVPTPAERHRAGGAGIYYHFDYHGGPRSYQWINTNPLPKIWEQMSLARQYGADRIWIVNVGHFKGYEVPTEYFLQLGWTGTDDATADPARFLQAWAAREFGPKHAGEIADVVATYAKFNGRRKPELLAPATYSLTAYRESERVVADYRALTQRAERLQTALPADKRDAFYELVLFPVKASALVNELYRAAGLNGLYAQQHRASAPRFAAETRRLFAADLALMDDFNRRFAGGKWDHFMDQPHLGYTTWRDPPKNSLAAMPLVEPVVPAEAALGVALDDGPATWPGTVAEPALRFDRLNDTTHRIELFNRGRAPAHYTLERTAPWLRVSSARGVVTDDARVDLRIRWSSVPPDGATAELIVHGEAAEVRIRITASNPVATPDPRRPAFVENDGVIAIEPEHWTAVSASPAGHWRRIPDYGRTLSGIRAELVPADVAEPVGASLPDAANAAHVADAANPAHTADAAGSLRTTDAVGTARAVNAPPAPRTARTRTSDAPVTVEYALYTYTAGPADVIAVAAPTLNFQPGRPLRYAVSIDDEPAQVVTLVPGDYAVRNGNKDWERTVEDNARSARSHHTLTQPGYHTLRITAVDSAVVLQRLLIDLGGLKPSYLGPPESRR